MSDSWLNIAKDNLDAAGELIQTGRVRSAINRAYFAAFAAVTHQLDRQKVNFPAERESPWHGSLQAMVRSNLSSLGVIVQRRVNRSLTLLYALRCQADYSRRVSLDQRAAKEAMNNGIIVYKAMET